MCQVTPTKGSEELKFQISISREKPETSQVHRDEWVMLNLLKYIRENLSILCIIESLYGRKKYFIRHILTTEVLKIT